MPYQGTGYIGKGDKFYLLTYGYGGLYCLDRRNGEEIWAGQEDYGLSSGIDQHGRAAIGLDGSIYVIGERANITAISEKGEKLWEVESPAEYRIRLNPPRIVRSGSTPRAIAVGPDGRLYVATSKGLYACSTTGKVIYKYPELQRVELAPVFGPDGAMYVIDGSTLYAFRKP
jgi:outer membrane protein assembly factor BamB